jgi:hypothetical protein
MPGQRYHRVSAANEPALECKQKRIHIARMTVRIMHDNRHRQLRAMHRGEAEEVERRRHGADRKVNIELANPPRQSWD